MFKVGGFIATLATGALMVGTAVTGTGAYFQDSKGGDLSGHTGTLTLGTSDNRTLAFKGLMPGVDQTQSVKFNVNVSDGKADVWLVFRHTAQYAQWTGATGDPLWTDGGLGRYGHVQIGTDVNPNLFESYNLKLPPAGADQSNCADSVGHGHGVPATSETDKPPFCGVPAAILVAKDMDAASLTRTLDVTFGVTGKWTAQDSFVFDVPFEIVATQANVRPDAPNF
jgi:hypothetical protein